MGKNKRKKNKQDNINHQNKQNSKKKENLEKITRREFFKKAGKFTLATAAVGIGGYILYKITEPEKAKINIKQKKLTQEENYKIWMQHYNEEGIYAEDLLEKSKITRKIMKKFESITEEERNKIFSTPLEKFLNSEQPSYKNFLTKFVANQCARIESEEWLMEATQILLENEQIKSFNKILNYINENKEQLKKLNDDDLAYFALNTAYFAIRNTYKSSEIELKKKEDLYKALNEKKGDCEIFSFLTRDLYLTIIKILDRKKLCKKVAITIGIYSSKTKKEQGAHDWLTFENHSSKKMIETNHKIHDSLLTEEYDVERCTQIKPSYLLTSSPNEFYIPIMSIVAEEATEYSKDYTPKRKIHILPEEIAKEIGFVK